MRQAVPIRFHALCAGIAALCLVAVAALLAAPAKAEPKSGSKSVQVEVMTRNLFLGADLGPAINSGSPAAFVEANGGVLREVTETDFPRRAPGLAAEIAGKRPDLVGLQEVALWRTGPPSLCAALGLQSPSASTVRYDFLELLLDQLAARGVHYEPVAVGNEFDFEAPADEDGDPQTSGVDPCTGLATFGGELNGRLTMRDVILRREGSKVTVSNPTTGHFEHLLNLTVGGAVNVTVTRGWTAVDAQVARDNGTGTAANSFRFVNTHLEAFDDETQVPSIRALQAGELFAPGGPADADRVILLGDLNSDDDTVGAGDQQAYRALLAGGFSERSTDDPLSCCVNDLFTAPPSQFDHQVDHVMTNAGDQVRLVHSAVTGLTQVNGIYDSDHAGVFSRLKLD